MNKIILVTIILIFYDLFKQINCEKDVIKVYDKGQDGGSRIYTIVCPNGKKTTVTQTLNNSGVSKERREVKELGINSDTGSSFKSTTQNLKKRALRLLGQQNRAEMCLYPVNSKKQCKSYKDVDAAAQAACNLLN